jgi:hypothetical protein
MSNFSTCDSGCNTLPSLSHSEAQISYLVGKIDEKSYNTRIAWFDNDAWASDLAEDRDLNGEDYIYGDAAMLYAYSGHGGANNDSSGNQHYDIPMCHVSGGYTGSCDLDVTTQSKLGDYISDYYGYPHYGDAKWAVLMTCHSADSHPEQQWTNVYHGSFTYVCGYRGLSYDMSETEDVGANFVNDAFVYHTYEFKATWFSAAANFWEPDTAEVFTKGNSLDDVLYRRDHYTAAMSDNSNQDGGYWAYAYNNTCWDC